MPFGSTGLVHRQGVGERHRERTRAGRRSSRATSCARSTRATARSRPRRGAALAGLSEGGYGALNIGIHHPGEFRVLESWSGYERADDIGAIFGHRAVAARARTARSITLPARRGGAAARAHATSGSTAARTTRSGRRTRRSRPSSTRARLPASLLPRARRPQLGALARQRGARASSPPRGGSVARRLAASAGAARRSRVAATGWLYLVRAARCPGRASARRCRSTSSSRHAAAPLLWFVVVWGAAARARSGSTRAGRALERLTAALLLGARRRRSSATSRPASRSPSCARSRCATHSTPPRGCRPSICRRRSSRSRSPLLAPRRARARGARRSSSRSVVAAGGALNLVHAILPGDDSGHPPTRSRPTPSGRSRARRARSPRSRCSSRHAASHAGAAAPGRSRPRVAGALDGAPRRCTASTTARSPPRSCSSLLVARRHDFDRPGRHRDAATCSLARARASPPPRSSLYACRGALAEPDGGRPAVHARGSRARETLGGLLGLERRAARRTSPGAFGDWFPLSLLLLGVAATAWIVAGWLAPWRHRVVQEERERELGARARPRVGRRHARTVRPARRQVVLLQRRRDRVPRLPRRRRRRDRLGRPDRPARRSTSSIARVRRACARARLARRDPRRVRGVARRSTRQHGLHALYHGDEAVVDTASFSLEGRAIRKVRQSVHRLEHAGLPRAACCARARSTPSCARELEDVARRLARRRSRSAAS